MLANVDQWMRFLALINLFGLSISARRHVLRVARASLESTDCSTAGGLELSIARVERLISLSLPSLAVICVCNHLANATSTEPGDSPFLWCLVRLKLR